MIFEDILNNPTLQTIYTVWKIGSILISIAFLIAIVWIVMKLNLLGMKLQEASSAMNASALPKRKLVKKWEEIERALVLGDVANRKIAVIEADKMFDFILESMGYYGKSMGEKLDQVDRAQFPRLNQIWAAHKVRNRIVHETDYVLTEVETNNAIAVFKQVLIDLGVL